MDNGDRSAQSQQRQGFQRACPLAGMDIDREYKLIKAGRSKWSPRICEMIINRVELGV